MKRNNKSRVFIAALAICLIGGIISFNAASAMEASEVDPGGGTCCEESKSTCVVGTVVLSDKYYQESGPCGPGDL